MNYLNASVTNSVQDEREGLVGAVQNETKVAGISDMLEAGLEFFISRIKSSLHVILCFSPVGDIFGIRRFPPLVKVAPSLRQFSRHPILAVISCAVGVTLGR